MDTLDEMNYFYYHMSLYELQIMNGNDYYHGLSYNSILYLNVIAQMEECTVSKIAEALNITKSAVTIKINELMKLGAVIKTQSTQDKRMFYIRISPDMEKNFLIYDQMFIDVVKKLKTQYSEEQLDLFNEILHSISNSRWERKQHES